MEFENYLAESYTPLRSIEILTDIIYNKSNDEWDLFSKTARECGEELLAINYAIKQCVKSMLAERQKQVDEIDLKTK